MDSYNQYQNPLIERYASREMSALFSPQSKFSTWRKLWIALAEAERELGIDIDEEQIEEMRAHVEDIDFEVARQREKEVRHDVMAHVYAHSDFFKNNLWFSHTNRRMLDEMANHGARVRRYIDRFGAEDVERFLDVCLSVDDLIDPNGAFDEELPIAQAFLDQTPLARIITVDECADVAVFLASDLSAAITGHVIPVDGGNHLTTFPSFGAR